MDTARCRAFIAAAKSGSLSKAAEELNYTTSAVSQLITALEEALEVTLFFRSRKGVTLTSDGERMYPVIYNFIRQEDLIRQTAADIRGLLAGEIVIAAYPSLCVAWLADIIHQFNSIYPNIRFQVDDSIRHYVLEALNNGRADIGFLSNQHDFSGEWIPIENNPMVAVVSRESRYAELDAFPIEECGRADLIQSSYGKDRDLDTIYSKYNITPHIVYTTRNSYTAAAMAEKNMGVLLVNEMSTRMWNFDLKILPLDPPQHISMGMAISTLSTASPAVKAFVKFVREYFAKNLSS